MLWVQGRPAPISFLPFPDGRGFGSARTEQRTEKTIRRQKLGGNSSGHRFGFVGSNPTVCTIGVTSCLAAARSVSLRKWSFLCAVRKRQDEGIYLLAGTGLVKMNGCD